MAFLSRWFKNLQWYDMTKRETRFSSCLSFWPSFPVAAPPFEKLKRGRVSYGRRGVGHVVFAPLNADGAARTARGEERIDLAHRPELRGRVLLADAHVVRLLRVGVDGADDRKTRGNAAAVERLRLDRAVVVDGRSLQVH